MMTEDMERVEIDRQMILQAQAEGTMAKLIVYVRLSGPGWLQGAITLGGGSLAGSLYLGVLAGYGLMWLQPLAMIMGIIMLSAIGYVSLSTGERPFVAINKHINPVLGWGWAIATLLANLVWCMPQFALGTAAIRQNLAPEIFGPDVMSDLVSKLIVVAMLFSAAGIVVWFYDSGGRGIKLFEIVLKLMVAVIVLSFFAVVVAMSTSGGMLDWGEIFRGFIPNPSLLLEPAAAFHDALASTGEYAEFWRQKIVSQQQQVMITAAATAVGINMTFLLPYSMMARGWGRDFRGLAVFDLATGLFIPFVLATSCVVIASAAQFHAQPASGFLGEKDKDGNLVEPAENLVGGFNKLVDKRINEQLGKEIKQQLGDERFNELSDERFNELKRDRFNELKLDEEQLKQARADLPAADRELAAMLVKRDAFNLADSLTPLAGRGVAQYVFGIGVLGMAISTIIILMLVNGFVICEMLGLKSEGTPHRLGCFLAACVGAAGPFLWTGDAKLWLAVPTSMFGMVLLPIAYFTFYLMMNSKSLLGDNLPTGKKRIAWNILMGVAAVLAAIGSYASINASPYKRFGFTGLGLFILLAVIVQVVRRKPDAGVD
jgi:Mn2+/Fe2+ NRAMP family transporter